MLRVHSAHCRLASSSLESHQSTGLVKLLVNSELLFYFLVLCFIMFFISVKAYGQVKTHFWKWICWHLDVDCQGWEVKQSNVETYPACWCDAGSVKFGCHSWKGVEERFEWGNGLRSPLHSM